VGPLRSARPYFAEIARSFDPIYVFFGTHPQYYEYIENLGMNVLSAKADHTGSSSIKAYAPYWRDWSRSDVLWHTACVSVPDLKQKAEHLGYPMEGGNIPFLYKYDPLLEARGNISSIDISFSTHAFSPEGFDVRYTYNKLDNSYYRYMAGAPHIDFNNEKQITAKNIVIMVSDIEGPIDQYGHMSVKTTGEGDAIFFQDGHTFMGSWERNDIDSQYSYLDGQGDPVEFTMGPIWVAIVQSIENVSY
jgi:hypothetical protein